MPCTYDPPGSYRPQPRTVIENIVSDKETSKAQKQIAKVHEDIQRHEQVKENLKQDLPRLEKEFKLLSDAYASILSGNVLDPKVLEEIEQEQINHRKEDLSRLKKTFTDKIKSPTAKDSVPYRALLILVEKANPKKPLLPQLGFDPDEY